VAVKADSGETQVGKVYFIVLSLRRDIAWLVAVSELVAPRRILFPQVERFEMSNITIYAKLNICK
jgi:hypothetical protein